MHITNRQFVYMLYRKKIISIIGIENLCLSILYMDNLSIYHIDNCFAYIMYRKHVHMKYRKRYFCPYLIKKICLYVMQTKVYLSILHKYKLSISGIDKIS